MLETLDYTIRIGSIPTFLYFDLYLYSAYAAHFVYDNIPAPLRGLLVDDLHILRPFFYRVDSISVTTRDTV